MSAAYKCDRCGELFLTANPPPKLNDIPIERIAFGSRDSYVGRSDSSDLCERCAKEFIQWWKLGDDL